MYRQEHHHTDARRADRRASTLAFALALAVALGALVAAAVAGPENGRPGLEDCVQRVKVWSPSRQTHIMRLQSFCN